MTTRLLIQSCSAAKRHDTGRLPAIERYDGPVFRVLRKAISQDVIDEDTRIQIISAEYGLLDPLFPIADYNRRMDRSGALALKSGVTSLLLTWLKNHPECRSVCVNLGHEYQLTIDDEVPAYLQQHGIPVTVCTGGIGQRLAQLKTWLEADR